ncbi:3' terminal RNA ribose 2'-O-methyltransferase Hen1 [Nakamurella sp. UYEF19]|uniref:3' terminal RNA ribose 2'-O-methyltransferase Hen1 n=1 Tax=Nakamurella sp. UYEF19 TaxID=1756392 RepID=UPI003396DF50
MCGRVNGPVVHQVIARPATALINFDGAHDRGRFVTEGAEIDPIMSATANAGDWSAAIRQTDPVFLTITMTAESRSAYLDPSFAGPGPSLSSDGPAVAVGIAAVPAPASDLGYLLHKHPDKVQAFDLPVGRANVFYPEVSDTRCTVALLLEVDPIALVRGKKGSSRQDGFSLGQYVNDRPYAASSMLAVAMARVFNTAMTGRCNLRPDLAAGPVPLEIHVPALPCRGGVALARKLFEPMGWEVTATPIPADPEVPRWGDSRYVDLMLTGNLRLADALHHLYVMLPVLDDSKHYWVGTDEVEKLIRAGAGWLHDHPERELITTRYLAHQRILVRSAVGRLAEIDGVETEVLDNAVPPDDDVVALERTPTLAEQRRVAVVAALRDAGAATVVDLGCGEGSLIREMLPHSNFRKILGVDVSHRALEIAARRLRFESMSDHQRERVELIQSSATYRDDRLTGYDAVVLMEVIEHVDPSRLESLQRTVFAQVRPETVIVTTPNVEYNVRYPDLPAGHFRHRDHRFEWTRAQFRAWGSAAAQANGYQVRYLPVGPDDAALGSPTQLALFTREVSV